MNRKRAYNRHNLDTDPRKVKIRDLATGKVIERHAIDARGMIASGTHEEVDPTTPLDPES